MNLKELLDYDPKTGSLTWKKRDVAMFAFDPQKHSAKRAYSAERACNIWNTRYAGKEALTALNNWGYPHGKIEGKTQLKHRVIWNVVTGRWPDMIDHVDGDLLNNRLSNLREATPTLNSSNRKIAVNNKSGVIGVFWNAGRKGWQAQVTMNGEVHNLGIFKTKEEAKEARRIAESAIGFVGRKLLE